jgi:hypothetical protein
VARKPLYGSTLPSNAAAGVLGDGTPLSRSTASRGAWDTKDVLQRLRIVDCGLGAVDRPVRVTPPERSHSLGPPCSRGPPENICDQRADLSAALSGSN